VPEHGVAGPPGVVERAGVDAGQPLLDGRDPGRAAGRAVPARVGQQVVEPGHAQLGRAQRVDRVHDLEVVVTEPVQLSGGLGPGHGFTQMDCSAR
jgi:hypothetical protein